MIVGLKETIKHSKGEGACCGGGAMKEDEEATVQLTGEIVTKMCIRDRLSTVTAMKSG